MNIENILILMFHHTVVVLSNGPAVGLSKCISIYLTVFKKNIIYVEKKLYILYVVFLVFQKFCFF